jgi:hypothetical protein
MVNCAEPAIRAHSVQNARVLDLLAKDGHVVAPNLRIDAHRGPSIDLKSVGRNRATTFAGLCSSHDRSIFAPIETAPIDLQDREHLFLLAYRATFYEVHATAAVAVQFQGFYQKRVELGIDPKSDLSPAGWFATERLMVAYETFQYKSIFDEAYIARNFDALEHDLITLDVERPTLAACTLFSTGTSEARDDLTRICMTILPLNKTRTIALLSYLPEDAGRARAELSRVLSSSGAYQKYELSRRLLNHCQNFVLAPTFVDSWTPEKRSRIIDLFARTVDTIDLDYEDADLQLFT